MISVVILFEEYGVPRPGVKASTIPPRPLPSVYFRKPIQINNPDHLEQEALRSKSLYAGHVARGKPHQSLGYLPLPGQQLTIKAVK
jgi:hypothetical protein